MNSLRLTRGATTPTREYALACGLSLENTMPGGIEGKFPGLHFVIGEEGTLFVAQANALQAYLRKREIPVVIDFTLTPENNSILNNRLWFSQEGYVRPVQNPLSRTWNSYGEMLVNLKGITHEEILKLEAKVGFLESGREFQYKTYEEWSKELNVRAENWEEMYRDFDPQRRK